MNIETLYPMARIDPESIRQGRFETLPETLLFSEAGPLAEMLDPAKVTLFSASQISKIRDQARKEGLWPEEDPALLWLCLTLEWQDFLAQTESHKRPARYLNTLCDQLRDLLLEIPRTSRQTLLGCLGIVREPEEPL